jgi:hypothetical protein
MVIRATPSPSWGGIFDTRSNDMDQERMDQISHTLAAGSSRRGILRALGVGGASGLLAVVGREAMAADRPHERLQDRTPKRNRKQRNKNQNNNDNNKNDNNNNDNQNTNQLGGFFGLGASVAFSNPTSSTYKIRVIGENGDLNYDCPPGFNATLSTDDTAVLFVIQYPGWADNLYMQAFNPLIGEPVVDYDTEYNCTHSGEVSPPIYCGPNMVQTELSEGESVTIPWLNGKSFTAERQSDSSDFKMFLVTALA